MATFARIFVQSHVLLWHDPQTDADMHNEAPGVDAWWHVALVLSRRALLSAMVDEGVRVYDSMAIEQVFRPTMLLRPRLPKDTRTPQRFHDDALWCRMLLTAAQLAATQK